jgi:carbon-monoxide dehydrogenase medium subunit
VRDFTFHAPESIEEVLALMDLYGEDARVMAGGTALVNLMKQSLVDAAHIISLARLPAMDTIDVADGALHVGPLARMRDVETSPLVRERVPLLADAYSRVGTVRVRNMASVGGGLAHADPAQDPPPALLVLDASVNLSSSNGERTVALTDFFRDYYETAIRPGELLTGVTVPLPSAASRSVYFKYLPRSAEDYATVGVAALGEVQDGVCTTVRVALAGAGPTPVVATGVQRELTGQPATAEAIRRAAEAVVEDVDPLDDARGSADYKRDMAVVWTRRALERVLLPA